MTKQQPMKMAAAEALCSTERGAGISIFAIGSISAKCDEVKSITVPGLLSFLATDSTDGTVQGVNDLQAGTRSPGTGPATTCRACRSRTGASG